LIGISLNVMKTRGEHSFSKLPPFGARLYDWLLFKEPIYDRLREIAHDLVLETAGGNLLDIGTGPGRLLKEINLLNPYLELYGLDISASMIQLARKILQDIPVNLQSGTIRHPKYENDFFNTITCTGSFYLWDYPEESLEEIYRILKRGYSAYLYEVYKDINEADFLTALKKNLRQLDLIRRIISPIALRKSLNLSYQTEDFSRIIEKTSFAESYTIEKISLSGLPMWVRITLNKMTE